MKKDINYVIGELVDYALASGLIEELDSAYATARLLEILKLSDFLYFIVGYLNNEFKNNLWNMINNINDHIQTKLNHPSIYHIHILNMCLLETQLMIQQLNRLILK